MSTTGPGRYQRNVGGLVGAMIILLLAVGAYVAFRATFRAELDVPPTPVDYLALAQQGQEIDIDVVYPASLPAGWVATGADIEGGAEPLWRVGLVTADEMFVGLRQSSESENTLLTTYVGDEPVEGAGYTSDGGVVARWRTYETDDGDLAYATDRGDQILLVYGSASEADLRELIGRLSTAPLNQ